MSIGASPTVRDGHTDSAGRDVPAGQILAAALKIDVDRRWDALALSERLIPFHSFLVQHTRERRVVHARAPGSHGEPLADALRTIEQWRAERRLNAPVRVADRRYGSRQ